MFTDNRSARRGITLRFVQWFTKRGGGVPRNIYLYYMHKSHYSSTLSQRLLIMPVEIEQLGFSFVSFLTLVQREKGIRKEKL